MTDLPRRNQMLRWTPAERAIYEAMQLVEQMGADLALTDAVILLGKARYRVADYVDANPAAFPPEAEREHSPTCSTRNWLRPGLACDCGQSSPGPEAGRVHRCQQCRGNVPEEDGTWPCEGEFVGDRGPEGFMCYECLEQADPDPAPDGAAALVERLVMRTLEWCEGPDVDEDVNEFMRREAKVNAIKREISTALAAARAREAVVQELDDDLAAAVRAVQERASEWMNRDGNEVQRRYAKGRADELWALALRLREHRAALRPAHDDEGMGEG